MSLANCDVFAMLFATLSKDSSINTLFCISLRQCESGIMAHKLDERCLFQN